MNPHPPLGRSLHVQRARVRLSLGVAAATVCACCVGFAAAWQVWTVAETRHVLRSEPPSPNACAVSMAAARNEWRSFRAGPTPRCVRASPRPGGTSTTRC